MGDDLSAQLECQGRTLQAYLADSAVDGPPLRRDAQTLLAVHVGLETPARMHRSIEVEPMSLTPARQSIVCKTGHVVVTASPLGLQAFHSFVLSCEQVWATQNYLSNDLRGVADLRNGDM